MRLTPTEVDRLLLLGSAEIARRRLGRGLQLNHPEAVAVIASEVIEAARDGVSYDEAVERGQHVLTRKDVLDGIDEMVDVVTVEAVFADGSKVVHLVRPIT